MKSKILAELVKKFPGLSKEFLGFIASKLEAKVTEDSQIEGAITELDKVLPIKDQVDFLQREGDRRVSEAKKKFEDDQKKKEEEEQTEEEEEEKEPAEKKKKKKPETISKEDLTKLEARIAAFEKKEAETKLSDLVKNSLSEKKIPLRYLRGRTLESEDKLPDMLTEIEKEYNEDKQALINEGYSGARPPLGGNGGTSKTASKEEIDSVVKEIM